MVLFLFHALVAAHIVTGSIGAIAFWVPVIGRKGGANHARWGKGLHLRAADYRLPGDDDESADAGCPH